MVMYPGRQTVNDYLAGAEELTRQELVWGTLVREPAPSYPHQAIVTRAVVLLDRHVREQRAGLVCVSPLDVVLDADKRLVVQPDVVFVSHDRAKVLRNQMWGAPDLAVEVESPGTRRRDRTLKLGWYRQYGVREYWLVDPLAATVTVIVLDLPDVERHAYREDEPVRSRVLPEFDEPASAFFE